MQQQRDWTRHVGERVVVRVRAPGGRTRDVLGDLLDADDTRLTIHTRRGPEEVQVADVLAGRPVPPPPVRAAAPHRSLSVTALETVMARHWQAPETARLGDWLLRAGEGFTNRANSVLPLGEAGRPAEAAVAAAADWYRARGLPPRAALPGDPGLAAAAEAFAAAGWAPIPGAGAHVLTAPTASLRSAADPPPGLSTRLTAEPDAAWLARYHYRGQQLPPIGRALLLSAPRQVFAAVRDGGETVAIARGSLAAGWAGLTAVEVDPDLRRRGLARYLMGVLAEWAWREGALSTYVQVGETNEPALTLYEAAGFERHHSYAYLESP